LVIIATIAICALVDGKKERAHVRWSESGSCGENMQWVMENNKLTITGSGKMTDYNETNPSPWEHIGFESVEIGEGVESIGNYAFYYSYPRALSFPSTLKTIGDYAFYSSSSLQSISFPSSLTSIGSFAFFGCSGLMVDLTIPKKVYSIGAGAFCGGNFLSFSVNSQNSGYVAENGALMDKKKTTIFAYAQRYSGSSYTIPSSVTLINDYAFSGSVNLQEVTIPDTVSSIRDHAFNHMPWVETVKIGKGVLSIGEGAFSECQSLTSITVDSGNDYYITVDGVLFDKNKYTLIQYPLAKASDSISIPSSVTKISSQAFFGARNLKQVTIVNGLQTIEDEAFSESGLTSVSIPASVSSMGKYAFSSCSNLNTVTIANGVASIGEYAFSSCSNLAEVDIPASVTTIQDSVFQYCTSLNTVSIKGDITSIGSNAFCGCEDLTKISIPDTVTYIGDGAFSSSGLTEIKLPSGLKRIENYCFGSTDLKEVIIPYGVTSLGRSAFSNCDSLVKVTIPDTVEEIGRSCFHSCEKITDVKLPSSLKIIGEEAFSESPNFGTTVTIPASVTTIELWAFGGCPNISSFVVEEGNKHFSSLDGVLFNKDRSAVLKYPEGKADEKYTLPDTVTKIENNSMEGNLIVSEIVIPESVKIIGQGAFYYCLNLSKVNIPDSVITIGEAAFAYCPELTVMTIPETVTFVGEDAFGDDDALETLFYQGSEDSITCEDQRHSKVTTMCVSPDYTAQKFCGITVTYNSPLCKTFQTKFSNCSRGAYDGETIVAEKKRSAKDWVSQSNGCVEYTCEENPAFNVLCESGKDGSRMCVEGECTENWSEKVKGWYVDIQLKDGVKFEEFNMTKLVEDLNNLTKIAGDEVSVSYEVDDQGNLKHIIVKVKDEQTAQSIKTVIDDLNPDDSCQLGILCKVDKIDVHYEEELLSGAYSIHHAGMFVLVALVLLFAF